MFRAYALHTTIWCYMYKCSCAQNLDATELLLVNGMRVVIKHTTHMEDELFLTGVAAGGLTEVSVLRVCVFVLVCWCASAVAACIAAVKRA